MNDNEPTTLADIIFPPRDDQDSDTDSTPSEATDAAVRGSVPSLYDRMFLTDKERLWQAWLAAWNQRGSTDSMDDLEERTARTAFEQWWEKDA